MSRVEGIMYNVHVHLAVEAVCIHVVQCSHYFDYSLYILKFNLAVETFKCTHTCCTVSECVLTILITHFNCSVELVQYCMHYSHYRDNKTECAVCDISSYM